MSETADGKLVVVLRNPLSGSARNRWAVRELVGELRRLGLRVRLFSSRERLQGFVRRTPSERLRCVVAAGGDGTVNDLLNRLPGVPLAVLPLGTENLLARHFRLPLDGRSAARVVAAGRKTTLDVWQANGRRFLLMASVGFDAEVVHRVHRRRTGPVSKATYVGPILRAARQYEFPELELTVLDGSAGGGSASDPHGGAAVSSEFGGSSAGRSRGVWRARHVVLSNLPVYALGLKFSPDCRGDDGRLDACLFDRAGWWAAATYGWDVWRGRHVQRPDVQQLRLTACRIDCPAGRVPVQVDGDPCGFTPVEIVAAPEALQLVCP